MSDPSKELPTTTRHNKFAKWKVKGSRYSVLALAAFFLCTVALHQYVSTITLAYDENNANWYINELALIPNRKPRRKVSAVILTYTKHEKFSALLDSVIKQKQDNFELIIADSGCLPETQQVIQKAFSQNENKWLSKSHKYIQLCHNPGYAVGNNEAVKLADPSSEWILLLNDDIIMQGESFITDMLRLGESKSEAAGAVGCTLRTITGERLQEAGSIVWNDSTAAGFGRDRRDINAPEFNYPRPVDYISGACLMVRKNIFNGYGGFDDTHFPNYYEDTDLQMHIQHDLRKEVWLQPKAVAFHDEHGSFSATISKKKMEVASKVFKHKWKSVLSKHVATPFLLPKEDMKNEFLRASDLRARDPSKARILYFDVDLPNQSKGSGFGRAFDNLSMLADLGHRITVVSYHEVTDDWCDNDCRDEIRQLGVELVTSPWEELVEERIGFYEIVIISRPPTFRLTYPKWRTFFQKSSFVLVYDCEALWYRRDEDMARLYKSGIEFPSLQSDGFDLAEKQLTVSRDKEVENKLLAMADIILPVAKMEEQIIAKMIPGVNIQTIGHVMSLKKHTKANRKKSFNQRNGILFVASFSGMMYYNGDAIWYFLKETYPLVLKEATTPIPLTIAGREIPNDLIKFVKDNGLDKHVTFLESPDDLDPLFESNRIFIAPHLYGSGIQYKLSEAFSYGIPCVTSKLSAKSFGLTSASKVTCVGENAESFKSCILSVHGSEKKWNELRKNSMSFIRRTHSRLDVKRNWSGVIDSGKRKYEEMKAVEKAEDKSGAPGIITHNLFSTNLWTPKDPCPEGEAFYLKHSPDVRDAIEAEKFPNAFTHWKQSGRKEGRIYVCKDDGKEVRKPKPIRRYFS